MGVGLRLPEWAGPDDADAIIDLIGERIDLGPLWAPRPDLVAAVIRDADGIVAVLMMRPDPEHEAVIFEQMEARRENDHATIAGMRGMYALDVWARQLAREMGAKRVIAPVQTNNHPQKVAMRKLGYSDDVHLFVKEL